MTSTAGRDDNLVRNALGIAVILAAAIGALGYQRSWFAPSAPSTSVSAKSPPKPKKPAASIPLHVPMELTADEKAKGYWECSEPDPGYGFYGAPHKIENGFVVIPERGGHDASFGYDVLLHFHGFGAVRKNVVRAGKAVVFAGLDLGNGSGPYSDFFAQPGAFERVKDQVGQALRDASGDPRAHIRHLALTAWSAGYGAVNEILKRGDDGIDAVVLLDGLHTGWAPGAPHDDPSSLEAVRIAPVIAFSQRAAAGEKIFFYTHSSIVPPGYASTTDTAKLLYARNGVKPLAAPPTDDPLGLLEWVDVKGFHVRGYAGGDERAHCDHTRFIADAIRDFLEPAWETPPAE